MADDISEPGGGELPASRTPAELANANPSPPPPSNPQPPAAALVVVTGERTEREVQLERELETERATRKKVECDNAQLSDELHRLATPAVPPAAKPSARPSCRRGPLGVRTEE
jgi:hypothetical protein